MRRREREGSEYKTSFPGLTASHKLHARTHACVCARVCRRRRWVAAFTRSRRDTAEEERGPGKSYETEECIVLDLVFHFFATIKLATPSITWKPS